MQKSHLFLPKAEHKTSVGIKQGEESMLETGHYNHTLQTIKFNIELDPLTKLNYIPPLRRVIKGLKCGDWNVTLNDEYTESAVVLW